MTLCREVRRTAGRWMLDPAFINRYPAGSDVLQFKDVLLSANGYPLEDEYEFILKDRHVLQDIQSVFDYVFFVAADEDYLKDNPVFNRECWDPGLKPESLICLGWAVYAFPEPAIMFGVYPITVDETGSSILQENKPQHINAFGLIASHALAEEYVRQNNAVDASEDANSGHWKSVGVFVEKTTHGRLMALLHG